jgi:hypothetical protein
MKTLVSYLKVRPLFMASLMLSLVLVTSCDKDDDDTIDNRPFTISGNAAGSQVVPAVSGTGTGTISGTYNPADRTLTYSTNWNGLTGVPTSAGLYYGASGVAGTSVGDPWTIAGDATTTGTMNGTMTLTADQATQLTAGNWYYSYGTTANPGGEVRGQITATR